MGKIKKILILLSILAVFATTVIGVLFIDLYPNFLVLDFIEYWSAYNLTLNSINPYNGILMRDFQLIYTESSAPQMMWNPPWIFLIISPMLNFDLLISAKIWLFISLFLFIISSVIYYQILTDDKKILLPILLGLSLSFPIVRCLSIGQLAGFLTFGSSLIFWGLEKNKNWILAFGLLLATLKPHLFYLVFVLILLVKYRRSDLFSLVPSILVFLFALSLCELIYPNMIYYWYDAMRGNQVGNTKTSQWMGGTLVGYLIFLLGPIFSSTILSLKIFIPLITILGVLFYYRNKVIPDWRVLYPSILLLSVMTSPFGWSFDFSVLIITHLVIMIKRPHVFYFVLLLASYPVFFKLLTEEHYSFFYVLLISLFYLIANKEHLSTDYMPENGK